MTAPEGKPFERSCLEALMSIGKTLSQMNLYTAAHPAVQAMLAETSSYMAAILEETANGELAYSIDQDNLIANGRIIGAVSQVPNSIPQFFSRFKLNSLLFRSGLSNEDLGVLCELAALRQDAAQSVQPAQFMAQKGVSHIVLDEAVYTKAKDSLAADDAEVSADKITAEVEGKSIDDTIAALVRYAVKDPKERALLLGRVMKKIRDDLEANIRSATEEIRGVKQVVENEQARSSAVFETMAQGVVTVDDQGNVLMMNPEAEELFGSRLAALAGKPIREGAGADTVLTMSEELESPKDRAIDGKVGTVGDPSAMATLRRSTAVIQNEAGKPVGVASALSDKAKHRQLEMVEREFIAHVTHELRAPLTSIRAALEIIEDMESGRMEAETHKMFDNALRNTDRLETLINGILDFSKIQAGQMTVSPAPVGAAAVAQEAVESMKPWATKKGVRLEFQAAGDLGEVVADLPRTVQVIVNLLSNSIKFTPRGGRIDVSVQPAGTGAADMVRFSVRDNGPGIPKDQQERVFEKFQQIVSGEKHVGGTGLGLAIAKALIHLQKGEMWLESEPGRGACFLFTLPKHQVERAAVPRRARKESAKSWWEKLLGL